MIDRILERIKKAKEIGNSCIGCDYKENCIPSNCEKRAFDLCTEIVCEVAKEYDWIPVEQKTPEDFTYVYATCVSLVDDRKAWVIEGVYHSLTGWEELTPYLSLGKAKVIAWMPKKLPAPYQKGE